MNRHRPSPHRTVKKSGNAAPAGGIEPSVAYKQKLAAEENTPFMMTSDEFDSAIKFEREIARKDKVWGFAFGLISGIFSCLAVFAAVREIG